MNFHSTEVFFFSLSLFSDVLYDVHISILYFQLHTSLQKEKFICKVLWIKFVFLCRSFCSICLCGVAPVCKLKLLRRHYLKLTAMIHCDFNRPSIRYYFKMCGFAFQRKRSLEILVQLKICKPSRSAKLSLPNPKFSLNHF